MQSRGLEIPLKRSVSRFHARSTATARLVGGFLAKGLRQGRASYLVAGQALQVGDPNEMIGGVIRAAGIVS